MKFYHMRRLGNFFKKTFGITSGMKLVENYETSHRLLSPTFKTKLMDMLI